MKIASWIKHALNGGIKIERTDDEKVLGLTEKPVPSDFLILLRNRKMIPKYAMRLEELGIPFEVAGGKAFSSTYALNEIVKILKSVADPDSAVDLVATLRGSSSGSATTFFTSLEKQAVGSRSIPRCRPVTNGYW